MIEYANDGCFGGVLFKYNGSVLPSSLAAALPVGMASVILMMLNLKVDAFLEQFGGNTITSSQLWTAMSATLLFLLAFRTNKAYGRFWDGTTLLHQMFGEWFDASSCLVAFSSLARESKPDQVWNFRHTLIRLMSLMHSSALDEIAHTCKADEGYPTLDIGGLDQGTLRYLRDANYDPNLGFNRVEVLIHMIQTLVVHAQDCGTIKIPPPILSRVFQTLSRGQVNLANCKKITHTMFPFPYAQVIGYLLMWFAVATPVVMASICHKYHFAFFFSAIPVFGVFALNRIAQQLEMPFGGDANDLPLLAFQEHMNNSLLMLIRGEADHVPFAADTCHMDYNSTKAGTSTRRPKHFLADPRAPSEIKCCGDFADLKAAQTFAPASEKAPPPPVPTPVPAPSTSPQPPPPVAKPPGVDPCLQKLIEELGAKFHELMKSTHNLSNQLGRNTEIMTQFISHGMLHHQRSKWSLKAADTLSQCSKSYDNTPAGFGGNGVIPYVGMVANEFAHALSEEENGSVHATSERLDAGQIEVASTFPRSASPYSNWR